MKNDTCDSCIIKLDVRLAEKIGLNYAIVVSIFSENEQLSFGDIMERLPFF